MLQSDWEKTIEMLQEPVFEKVHKMYSEKDGWANITYPSGNVKNLTISDSFDYAVRIIKNAKEPK